MKATDSERTDGGATFESDLSRTEMSRTEHYGLLLDQWVLAPARVLAADRRAVLGAVLIFGHLLMGSIGVLVLDPPRLNEGTAMITDFETLEFPLGTTQQGTDVLRLVVHGTPNIIKMVASGAVFAMFVGTAVGFVSGYKGGTADQALMTINDIAMTIPGLPLVILLSAIFEPQSAIVVGLILGINNWSGLARSVRSQVLTLRDESYVEASRIMNTSLRGILVKDIAPSLMPYILVQFVYSARRIIFESVGLYFLGFLPTSVSNWGVTINRAYASTSWYYGLGLHWLVPPLIALITFSLGLILLAQGLDRVFNPVIRARHAKTVESDGSEHM